VNHDGLRIKRYKAANDHQDDFRNGKSPSDENAMA